MKRWVVIWTSEPQRAMTADDAIESARAEAGFGGFWEAVREEVAPDAEQGD